MKKRLLITSIVMMLVVAVALSTATYAWFTSNANVTASTIKITASTSDAAALGIGWIQTSDGSYLAVSNSITADGAGTYKPMVPAELTDNSTLHSVAWSSATIKTVNGVVKFNGDVKTSAGVGENHIEPYTFGTSTASALYVKNLSNANSISNLKLTITWDENATYTDVTEGGFKTGVTYYTYNDGTKEYTEATGLESFASGTHYYVQDVKNDNLVRVAVFAKAAATAANVTGNYVLKGVLGKTADLDTEYGTVTADGVVADLCTSEKKTVSEINFGTLDKNQQVDIVILVWLDGVALNDDEAGKVSSFGLNFAAAAPTPSV